MSVLSLRSWRWTHLLLVSVAYWIVLALVTVVPAVTTARQFIDSPDGRGEISVSASATSIEATITNNDVETWSLSVDVLVIALALAIPPLLLWVVWVMQRPARRLDDVVPAQLENGNDARLRVASAAPALDVRDREVVRLNDGV